MITARRVFVAAVLGGTAKVLADNFKTFAPPDASGIWAPGNVATYVSHRSLFGKSMAREFRQSQISTKPFANGPAPDTSDYRAHQAGGFKNWRLEVGGLVSKPLSLSLDDLRAMPAKSQITQLVCEEGWSYIAEWKGVLVSDILQQAGAASYPRWLFCECVQPEWKDSIDMADAWHPQTLVAYSMNGADVPPGHGGPLRLRVPRQLGYKSLKYLNRLTVADTLDSKSFGGDYAWYAGI